MEQPAEARAQQRCTSLMSAGAGAAAAQAAVHACVGRPARRMKGCGAAGASLRLSLSLQGRGSTCGHVAARTLFRAAPPVRVCCPRLHA